MTKKEKMLKPRVLECIDRLRKFVDLNAPPVIVGAAAWNVYTMVLAAYGTAAGSTMIQDIRDQNLHARGVCGWDDCTGYVDRPGSGVCEDCWEKHIDPDGELTDAIKDLASPESPE